MTPNTRLDDLQEIRLGLTTDLLGLPFTASNHGAASETTRPRVWTLRIFFSGRS